MKRVVVAMSGGVDSSVAAFLLRRDGYQPIGVSMQVWDYRRNGGSSSRATCCAPSDFQDARAVAAALDIPYYVFDFEESFQRNVIDQFINAYAQGKTPNPCVECNRRVKFRELRERTRALGVPLLATGHYARIVRDQHGAHLLRGTDASKDQSYFLFALQQRELNATIFPIGHLAKQEVREIAREQGLPTADKPESQDICFVSGSVSDFLVTLGARRRRGEIVDRNGHVLGHHDGVQNFTVGQRRGLRVGGSARPLYVLELDCDSNRVVIGEKSELARDSFSVEGFHWTAPPATIEAHRDTDGSIRCIAQLRYRHRGVRVKLAVPSSGEHVAHARFVSDWTTVSPGQAAVFYDESNQEVLGGGMIQSGAEMAEEAHTRVKTDHVLYSSTTAESLG